MSLRSRPKSRLRFPAKRAGGLLHAAVVLALVGCLLPVPASAGPRNIYMYRSQNGTPYFTDTKPLNTDDALTYIGKYGRPTASSSCQGVTAAALETRASNYSALIAEYAQAYNVDPQLVKAVMRVESCFDANAVSRVGAQGLMQLLPETAYRLGVRDSFDPAQNIRGGVRYLSMMLSRFNNDHSLALAAYNAGPLAVERYRGVPPYAETLSYVRRVKTNYQQYLAP